MRDPERIDSLLAVLARYWKAHPDLRLAQIIGNATGLSDPYYFEDSELLAALLKMEGSNAVRHELDAIQQEEWERER